MIYDKSKSKENMTRRAGLLAIALLLFSPALAQADESTNDGLNTARFSEDIDDVRFKRLAVPVSAGASARTSVATNDKLPDAIKQLAARRPAAQMNPSPASIDPQPVAADVSATAAGLSPIITTFAGMDFNGDGGLGTNAYIQAPTHVAIDAAGNCMFPSLKTTACAK